MRYRRNRLVDMHLCAFMLTRAFLIHVRKVYLYTLCESISLSFAPLLFPSPFFIFSPSLSLFLPHPLSLPSSLSLFSHFLNIHEDMCMFALYSYKNIPTHAALCVHTLRSVCLWFYLMMRFALNRRNSGFYCGMKIASLLINAEYNNKCTYILPHLPPHFI